MQVQQSNSVSFKTLHNVKVFVFSIVLSILFSLSLSSQDKPSVKKRLNQNDIITNTKSSKTKTTTTTIKTTKTTKTTKTINIENYPSCSMDTGGKISKTKPSGILVVEEINAFVDFHNKARKEVGCPPVEWSEEIAKYAQEWADYLAKTNQFKHRPNLEYGENIAMSYKDDIVHGAELWYSEIKDFKSNNLIFGSDHFPGQGHYTQIVWRKTTHIGAGKAVNKNGQVIIVCNYNPAGNYKGEKIY